MMSPQNTYLAAMISLYDFKNPQQCLKFLEQLNSLGFENYEHNNLLRAKALVGGRQDAAIFAVFRQKNSRIFLYHVLIYITIGLSWISWAKKPQANAIGMHLKNLLETKGFSEKMLPELPERPG